MSGVRHQRGRRRKRSQSSSSKASSETPNPCSQALCTLGPAPQDGNASDHKLTHNRAQTAVLWINCGRTAQEQFRPGHCHISTNFLPQVTVSDYCKQTPLLPRTETKRDKSFWFELLLAAKRGQPEFGSRKVAWNNYQKNSKTPIQFFIGTLF